MILRSAEIYRTNDRLLLDISVYLGRTAVSHLINQYSCEGLQ